MVTGLGLDLKKLIKGDGAIDKYEYTQQIGAIAKQLGYDAIIAPVNPEKLVDLVYKVIPTNLILLR